MESRDQGTHSRQHGEENPLEPQLWPHLKQPEEGGRARAAPLGPTTTLLGGQNETLLAYLEMLPSSRRNSSEKHSPLHEKGGGVVSAARCLPRAVCARHACPCGVGTISSPRRHADL